MTSESQERMLAIVRPDDLDEVLDLCRRWEVRATVVGRVTEGDHLRILDGPTGEVLADMPAVALHDEAPKYDRPRARPASFEARQGDDPARLSAPADPGADLLSLLADTSWVWSQYDHQLFLNTVEGPGGDAALLRLKAPGLPASSRALAVTVDSNARWCSLDPRLGTALTVAESVLNLACVGARAVAVVDCLNLGNPEHPEVMWQLSEVVDGMADACQAFDLPVVGGNVSLYNESRGRDIDPTPVVGALGLVDNLARRPPGVGLVEGHEIYLVGDDGRGERSSLAASLWASVMHGHRGGRLAPLDAALHQSLASVLCQLVGDGLLSAVHDVSAGGLGVALAEMAVSSDTGFWVGHVQGHQGLFAEGPSRAVICLGLEESKEMVRRLTEASVPYMRLGQAGGDRLTFARLLDVSLDDATLAWRRTLPRLLDLNPS